MSETINHNNSIDENVDSSNVSIKVIDSAGKLWSPKSQDTKLTEFQAIIETKFNLKFATYDDFYKWSIENFVNFWEEFWHYSKIKYSKTYHQVLDKPNETIDNLPFKWFDGALLNYAENLLQNNDDKIAIYSYGEAFKEIKKITFNELRQRIKTYQTNLRELGVKRGDRVVGYMPNCIEFIEAKLATISLGAVWSCASPDFGAQSVVERFKQISPKVIFSVSSVYYNGKKHDHVAKLNEVVKGVDSIEKVIIIPFCEESIDDFSSIPKSVALSDFLASNQSNQSDLTFEQVPFNHPLVILYSSGTTGTPVVLLFVHIRMLILLNIVIYF